MADTCLHIVRIGGGNACIKCGEMTSSNSPHCQHQFFKVKRAIDKVARCFGAVVVCALCDEKRILWDNKKMTRIDNQLKND